MNASMARNDAQSISTFLQSCGKIVRVSPLWATPPGTVEILGFNFSKSNISTVSPLYPNIGRVRGLQWKDYPIVEYPETFQNSVEKPIPFKTDYEEAFGRLSAQPLFLYDEKIPATYFDRKRLYETRYLAAKTYRTLGLSVPLYARLYGEKDFQEIVLSDLENPAAGWFRYVHSYQSNFAVIGCRALDYIMEKYKSERPWEAPAKFANKKEEFLYLNMRSILVDYRIHRRTELSDPWGIQTLFALRNSSDSEREVLGKYINLYDHTYMPINELPKMTFGNHVKNGHWVGSGKYKVKYDLRDEIGWVFSNAQVFGLVEFEKDGKLRLTDAGEAFLDIMHADNYDPDAFLRFIDPETKTMPISEVDRIDAWMMRFFKKMKTKVSALT